MRYRRPEEVEAIEALLAEGRNDLEGSVLETGTGSGEPFGIVTALAVGASELALPGPTCSPSRTSAGCEFKPSHRAVHAPSPSPSNTLRPAPTPNDVAHYVAVMLVGKKED